MTAINYCQYLYDNSCYRGILSDDVINEQIQKYIDLKNAILRSKNVKESVHRFKNYLNEIRLSVTQRRILSDIEYYEKVVQLQIKSQLSSHKFDECLKDSQVEEYGIINGNPFQNLYDTYVQNKENLENEQAAKEFYESC